MKTLLPFITGVITFIVLMIFKWWFDNKSKWKLPNQRCVYCGKRFNNPLADMCGECFENE